jgi:hypothetical protein
VDWYHTCEHLVDASSTLYPEDPEKAEKWFKVRRRHLFLGEIHAITEQLDQVGLGKQSRYFHNHQRRMRYQEYQEEGYPIGSGTVESGIKQFKSRLTGSGMRWSRKGTSRMLVIRGATMAGNLDELWATSTNGCRLS